MASREELAQWIVANKDKRGTPQFEVVAKAYQEAEESVASPNPPLPPEPSLGSQFMRGAGITARGALPTMALGAAGGALAGPPGAIAGSMMLPAAEALTAGANLMLPQGSQIPSPSGAVQNLMTRAGLPVPVGTQERAIEAGADALAGAGAQLPALGRLATSAAGPISRGISETLATAPGRQIASSAPSAMAAQSVGETYENPYAGMVAGAITGAPFGVGSRSMAVGPSKEALKEASSQSFKEAERMGIQINPEALAGRASKIEKDMRGLGYVSGVYPQIDAAFNQLKDTTRPKDFAELQALRKIIRAGQGSPDSQTRMLAGELKDEFDDYVLNAPQSDFIGTSSKMGAQAWNNARNQYSRLMKGEVFEDILAKSEISGITKYTQSGTENALAAELRKLTNNPKRMRLFSKSEQAEIRRAAKGGNLQNILRFMGKMAPTGTVSALPSLGTAGVFGPLAGATLAGAGLAGRAGATAMREQSVERLADMMRAGVVPPPATSVAPIVTGGRGAFMPLPGLLSQ